MRTLCPLAYIPWIRLALRGDVPAASSAVLTDFDALLCTAMRKRATDQVTLTRIRTLTLTLTLTV